MSFNKELALKLAELSQKCYSDYTYKKNDDGFLLVVENDIQYLAFPGSYEVMDWIRDSEFAKVYREQFGWIHDGFVKCYENVKDEIYKRLDKSKKLYITGHSLGSAQACLCGVDLVSRGFKIESIYTYGQPRIGNLDWKNKFQESKINLYRFKNGSDVVTEVPKLFYYHIGELVRIGEQKWFSWFHEKCFDHKIDNYIASLKKL